MSTPNPYAPPQAALQDVPAGAGSPVKAVTLGLAADIGGTVAATLIFFVLYGIWLGATGADPEEINGMLDTDSWLFWAATAVGLAFSVLGGYVCARIAKRAEMKLGAIVAVLSAAIGVLLSADQYQLGTQISMTLAAIGAVMAGARLGQAKNRGTK